MYNILYLHSDLIYVSVRNAIINFSSFEILNF